MTKLHATLLASIGLIAMPTSLLAQAVPAPKDEVATDDREIVVTGSRTITNGNDSPTPVTVIQYETLQTSKPGTLFEGLTQLPSLVSSRGTNANPALNGGIGGGNGAASQLNLRNVGATRSLVLFDGHRVPPTLFSGITDMDIIPQNVLSRVDLVTGGVSAVYGSDAVTGVINFITDRKYTGLKTGAQYGISNYNDGQQFSTNVSFGANLGDRGHILLSY
jgi:iron complex outermembrane recepter protein